MTCIRPIFRLRLRLLRIDLQVLFQSFGSSDYAVFLFLSLSSLIVGQKKTFVFMQSCYHVLSPVVVHELGLGFFSHAGYLLQITDQASMFFQGLTRSVKPIPNDHW